MASKLVHCHCCTLFTERNAKGLWLVHTNQFGTVVTVVVAATDTNRLEERTANQAEQSIKHEPIGQALKPKGCSRCRLQWRQIPSSLHPSLLRRLSKPSCGRLGRTARYYETITQCIWNIPPHVALFCRVEDKQRLSKEHEEQRERARLEASAAAAFFCIEDRQSAHQVQKALEQRRGELRRRHLHSRLMRMSNYLS